MPIWTVCFSQLSQLAFWSCPGLNSSGHVPRVSAKQGCVRRSTPTAFLDQTKEEWSKFESSRGQARECLTGRQEPLWGRRFVGDIHRWVARRRFVRCRPAGYQLDITAEFVSELCEQGQLTEAVEALGVLVQQQQTDCRVSQSVFYTVLKKCGIKRDLVLGRRAHALSVKVGYGSDTFLCNHIMRMYDSHARLQEAMDVFTSVDRPDAFMWSSILSAHVGHGDAKQAIELYHKMRRSNVKPDGHVFVAGLQACAREADLKTGQQIHADLLASGLKPHVIVCNCLVDMYAKCGNLEEAQRVFDGLVEKDVVTWTALIAGYSLQGMGEQALHLYSVMREEGTVIPDSMTFVALLQACASLGALALETGKQLHGQIGERGLQADVVLGGGLVNMYAKCGSLEDAQRVFDGLGEKNVVTWTALIAGLVRCGNLEDAQSLFDGLPDKDVVMWNAIIAGYSQQGMGEEALHLYKTMQGEYNVAPNSATFVCALQTCANIGTPALEKGKELHAEITERGLQADEFVASSLVNMYAKCGSLADAQVVFDSLGQKNVVIWSAMIAGYSQQGMGQEALGLYKAMQEEGSIAPDAVTFVCLLQACADVAALPLGRQLHAEIAEKGLEGDVMLAVSLINMYAKSGSMVDAQQVFEALPERDKAAWNALIAGYTCQGDSEVVIALFHRMKEEGVEPDGITFLGLLTGCSHAGLVDKGLGLFEAMSGHHGISPTTEHYTCMVDLLGRAGRLDESLALVRAMPVLPTAAVWHTLLGACRKWGNVEVGHRAFEEAVKQDKQDAAAYVLMANIYSDAQMWQQAHEMQMSRKEIGAWKEPGQSWWTDTKGLVHSFLV